MHINTDIYIYVYYIYTNMYTHTYMSMYNLIYILFVLRLILSISSCVYNVKDKHLLYTESKAV